LVIHYYYSKCGVFLSSANLIYTQTHNYTKLYTQITLGALDKLIVLCYNDGEESNGI